MFFNTFKKTIIVEHDNRLLFLYNTIHIFLNELCAALLFKFFNLVGKQINNL